MTDWSTADPPASNGYPAGCTRLHFARLLLAELGRASYMDDPMTRFVVGWMAHEGNNASTNNPLNTTDKAPGSKPLPGNPAGVQILPSLDVALGLYAQNLKTNPIYKDTFAALTKGTVAQAAAALQSSGWCGGPRAPCPGYGAKLAATAAAYQSDAVYGPQALWPAGTVPLSSTPAGQGKNQAGDIGGATPTDPFGLTDFLDAVGRIATWLLDPHNWQRAGLVAGGLLLAGIGLVLIKHDTLGQAATAIGMAVAPEVAVPAKAAASKVSKAAKAKPAPAPKAAPKAKPSAKSKPFTDSEMSTWKADLAAHPEGK